MLNDMIRVYHDQNEYYIAFNKQQHKSGFHTRIKEIINYIILYVCVNCEVEMLRQDESWLLLTAS